MKKKIYLIRMLPILMVALFHFFNIKICAQTTIFTESFGTVSSTTTIASHEASNAFDNDSYTMTSGGALNASDLRSTYVSSSYSGATGLANVFFTSSDGVYGFAIEGIDASTYTSLNVQFAYRKESANELPTLTLDYWNGTTYVNLPFTLNEIASAATGWYLSPSITLAVGAQVSNLKLRWVKTGNVSVRIDDVILIGTLLVSAPTTQASEINFGSIGQTGMTANWTKGNGTKRVVIMNTINSFTSPADATDPSANTVYGGSGEQVIYNGTGTSVAVNGLTASTTYYFRVYEYNGSGTTTKYLTCTSTNNPNSQSASSIILEPSNHATSFAAIANSSRQITLTWTDATGTQAPDGYLVKASTGTPTAPADGTAEADGTLVKNITQGTQSSVFTGLSASTLYNFSIWPYTNSGTAIDYKIGSEPTANATTSAALLPTVLQAGDIEILQLNSTNPDRLAFITFVDLNPNTIINFTDNGFNSPTAVRSGEGFLVYTAPASISAGTVITWYNGMTITGTGWNSASPSNFALASPDQLFAYQGIWDNTQTLIYGISTTPWITTGSATSNNSYFPVGLTDNVTAFSFTTSTANSYYSGTISGAIGTIKSFISNSSNWTSSSSDQGAQSWTPSFGNTTVLNANTGAANLTINSGETLTVNAAKQLTVTGTLTNNGTINLLSDVSGTATIKTPATISGSGSYTMKQYLPSYRTWYMTSPMTGTTNKPLDNNSAYPALLKWFDESKGEATGWTDITATGMTGGIGYVLNPGTISGASTLTFSGTINSGNQAIALSSRTGTADKAGFNLIGNPFPTYLDWKLVCDNVSNAAKMRSKTMWYRTKDGSFTFQTVNGASGEGTPATASRYIPPMQAFWVRAVESVSGTLAFNTDMRADAPLTNNLLKAPAQKNLENQKLRVLVSNGVANDEILLYTNANALDGYDAYDSPKMLNGSTSTVPDIYTLVGAEQLVINGMKELPYDAEIPLYFKKNASTANSFTLKANEISNFTNGTQIYIKNNSTGIKSVISDGSAYIFEPSNLGNPAFSLIIKAPESITDVRNTSLDDISIYVNKNRQIYVTSKNGIEGGTISVYNAVGQLQYSNSIIQSTTLIDKTFTPGVYMVKVNVSGKTNTQKVILN